MHRTWTTNVGGVAVVTALLLAPPAAGGAQDPQPEESERQRIERLEEEVRELREQMELDEETETPAPEATVASENDDGWALGYREGGGGFFLENADGTIRWRQLGYIQATGAVFHDDFERVDEPGDFSLRRARIDWIVDLYDRYLFFVEIDGGPGSTPGSSDFALVVAQIDAALVGDDDLVLTAGKFITPLSTENLLSSRSLDTVERYIALNSMFLLPALDVQFGTMVSGRVGEGDRLEYFVGVFNGNGRANDNLSDDNGAKEVQAKVNWHGDAWRAGLGVDWSDEERQSLQLRGLSFTPYAAVPVEGERRGVSADFGWRRGRWGFRTEGLAFDFTDSDASLAGGFVQASWALRGDRSDGEEILLRLETAAISSDRLGPVELPGDRIDAVTLGLNLFRRGILRLQLDAVAEHYDGPSNLPAGSSRVEGDGWKPYLLTMLQLKF